MMAGVSAMAVLHELVADPLLSEVRTIILTQDEELSIEDFAGYNVGGVVKLRDFQPENLRELCRR
jgi:hypothetical protein